MYPSHNSRCATLQHEFESLRPPRRTRDDESKELDVNTIGTANGQCSAGVVVTAEQDGVTDWEHVLRTITSLLGSAAAEASAFSRPTSGEPGRCSQTWCPVCALAAVAAGEQHPLVSLLAEHGAALLALLQSGISSDARSGSARAGRPADHTDTRSSGRYQHIPVTIRE